MNGQEALANAQVETMRNTEGLLQFQVHADNFYFGMTEARAKLFDVNGQILPGLRTVPKYYHHQPTKSPRQGLCASLLNPLIAVHEAGKVSSQFVSAYDEPSNASNWCRLVPRC